MSGEPTRYADALWPSLRQALGADFDSTWEQRRAEGFNNLVVGRWPQGLAP